MSGTGDAMFSLIENMAAHILDLKEEKRQGGLDRFQRDCLVGFTRLGFDDQEAGSKSEELRDFVERMMWLLVNADAS